MRKKEILAANLFASCSLTLAVQHGLGLEVELRRVRFGGGWTQRVGRERERIWRQLAGLTERLRAADHLLPLLLLLLRAWMGQLLRCRVGQLLGHRVGCLLRCRLGYGSCALQHRNKSCDVINRTLQICLHPCNNSFFLNINSFFCFFLPILSA